MKTLNLTFDDNFHYAMKNSAKKYNESLKKFIMNAIKTRLNIEDYIIINQDVQDYLNSKKQTNKYIKVKSIKDLF